jgi:hypothetical protein
MKKSFACAAFPLFQSVKSNAHVASQSIDFIVTFPQYRSVRPPVTQIDHPLADNPQIIIAALPLPVNTVELISGCVARLRVVTACGGEKPAGLDRYAA